MTSQPKTQYWIQDIAPNGGYFDSVGLSELATQEMAEDQLNQWRASFPERKPRLIIRIDVVLCK